MNVARPLSLLIYVTRLASRPIPPAFPTHFIKEIMQAPRSKEDQAYTLGLYNGIVDLEDYLAFYKPQMYVKGMDNATYCHYFLVTFKGVI